MRIRVTDKGGTEIELDQQEKRNLRRVARFLSSLSAYHKGKEEIVAAEAVAIVAAKWAPEAPEEKTNATK